MRLTIEEIENIRRNGVHAISFSERTDKVIELCDLALQSLSQESVRSPEGEGEACYYCHLPIHSVDSMRGGPVGLCHADEPGMVKWHHTACVSERLADQESVRSEALEETDGPRIVGDSLCYKYGTTSFNCVCIKGELAKLVIELFQRRALSPARVAESGAVQYGWLIERTDVDPPQYWAGWNKWTSDHMEAVRFCRQEDAFHGAVEYGHEIPDGMHAIREHSWSSPESPAKEQPGEQNAAPQVPGSPETLKHSDSTEPAVSAPDAAAMVRRLRDDGGNYAGYPIDLLREAAAMIEKLGQQRIPVAWAVTWNGDIVDNIFSTERAAKECMERLNRNHPNATRAIVPLAALPPPPERP